LKSHLGLSLVARWKSLSKFVGSGEGDNDRNDLKAIFVGDFICLSIQNK
jgi:hypothetical protein